MYLPDHFAETRPDIVAAFLEMHPMAQLVTFSLPLATSTTGTVTIPPAGTVALLTCTRAGGN